MLSSSDSNAAGKVLQPHKYRAPQRPEYKDLSIILPLSLVRRLVGRLDHPSPGAEGRRLSPSAAPRLPLRHDAARGCRHPRPPRSGRLHPEHPESDHDRPRRQLRQLREGNESMYL